MPNVRSACLERFGHPYNRTSNSALPWKNHAYVVDLPDLDKRAIFARKNIEMCFSFSRSICQTNEDPNHPTEYGQS